MAELTEEIRPLRERDGRCARIADRSRFALCARASSARGSRCGTLEFSDPGEGFSIIDGRHPLLVEQGIAVVPFDLVTRAVRANASHLRTEHRRQDCPLKSLGSSRRWRNREFRFPSADESRLAIFDDIYADVGDEQSISSSLSTFSAHLKNLSEVLRSATSAVARAHRRAWIRNRSSRRRGARRSDSRSAHQSRKSVGCDDSPWCAEGAGDEVDGVVNASLQFDPVALAPTYRLIKGIPGRSYGLSIARRLALPEDVLATSRSTPADRRARRQCASR